MTKLVRALDKAGLELLYDGQAGKGGSGLRRPSNKRGRKDHGRRRGARGRAEAGGFFHEDGQIRRWYLDRVGQEDRQQVGTRYLR